MKQVIPEEDWKAGILEKMVFVIALVYPITSIPQLYNIWVLKEIAGVSLLTWSLYFLLTLPLLIYVIVRKVKPYILMYSLWLFVYSAVIAGLVING